MSLTGFSKFVSDQIELHVADVLTVDATMKVGALTDEVTVTATAATVDRTTAELGQVVDARRIAELPIREGSPVELVILAPGVTVVTDLRSRKAAFNNGLSQFSTDGVGEKKNDFTIDGVSNVANDRVAYSPPSASVEEFKIHTTSYDAAIGNTMGAVVNLVTKSGTNALRGQAYEWFRGSTLDARNYFDRVADRPKREYNDNRFGGGRGRADSDESHVLLRQLRGESIQGSLAEHRHRADRENAQRRFFRSTRDRSAVSDLQPVHHSAEPDDSRSLRSRSLSRQHHSVRPHRSRCEKDHGLLRAARTRPAQRMASRIIRIRRPSHSRRITRPPDASITTSRRGIVYTAASVGITGRKRRTIGSTTLRPASSSIARTASSE